MKKLRKIGITLIVLIVAYFLLRTLNLIPDVRNWFKEQPVMIENTPIIVENIRDLNELITMASFDEVVISKNKINEGNIITNILKTKSLNPGISRIALIAKGRLFAGIDLKALKNEDVNVVKDSVSIKIPKAKIIDAIVNPSDCEVFIEEGIWSTIEISELKAQARQKIIDRSVERKLLEKADNKATAVIESFLRSVGFKKVTILAQ
jgi:hypothetical protein